MSARIPPITARSTARITRLRWLAFALGLGMPVFFSAGCRVAQPGADSGPELPVDGNAALMEYIGEQPYVSAEAAYRAIYVLWHGEPFAGDFASLAEALRGGNIIGQTWNHGATDVMDRQTVGFMICRAGRIRTGANWVLTGLGRYAWRELQYRGIAGSGGEWDLVSGGEFQGLIARADTYLYETRKLAARPSLGPAPGDR